MMFAFLVIPWNGRWIFTIAASSTTCRTSLNRKGWVIGFWFWRRRRWRFGGMRTCRGESGWSVSDGNRNMFRSSVGCYLGGIIFRLWSWSVIDCWMFPRRARWDGQEFVETENARFTTFPSCIVAANLCQLPALLRGISALVGSWGVLLWFWAVLSHIAS